MSKRKKTLQTRVTEIETDLHRLDKLHNVSSDALWRENLSTRQSLISINQRFDSLGRKIDFMDQKLSSRIDFLDRKMVSLFRGLEERIGKVVAAELRKHRK